MDLTYRNLIKRIPLTHNLASVQQTSGGPTCAGCQAIWPNRSKAVRALIRTDYKSLDSYPLFPVLRASAKSGCV